MANEIFTLSHRIVLEAEAATRSLEKAVGLLDCSRRLMNLALEDIEDTPNRDDEDNEDDEEGIAP